MIRIVYRDPESQREVQSDFETDHIRVGREGGNELVLPYMEVSRYHAEFLVSGEAVTLLEAMQAQEGLPPDGWCLAAAAKACARAADAPTARRVLLAAERGGRLRCSQESAQQLYAHATQHAPVCQPCRREHSDHER